MAITTYAELQTAIANWLHRTDLTAYIPDFITLAESYLTREIGFPDEETVGTVNITAGASSGPLPTYFSRLRSARLVSSPVVTLTVLTPEVMYRRYPTQAAGQPAACTIIGSSLYVNAPTDTAYTITIDYWAGITPLSTTNTTNWLLTKFPDAYLYTCLVQAAPFLGADVRIPTWASLSQRSIDGINLQGMLQNYGAPLEAQITANVA